MSLQSEPLPQVSGSWVDVRSSPLWHSHNPMATTLAPVDSREVVRCDHCLLVQFRTVNNNCRRCHSSLDEEPEPEPVVMAPPVMMPMPGTGRGHLNLATSIRSLRLRSGLSQRQLAGRMSVPRTYVSKIENEKATPTLSSLERLARALEVTVPELLSGGEKNRQDEISELMKDQFIAEIAAVRFATERDADVEHPDPGAGFDGAAAKDRVDEAVYQSAACKHRGRAARPGRVP